MNIFIEINSADDYANLQNSLDCFKLGLKINASKYYVTTFTSSRTLRLDNYYILDIKIVRVDDLVNLGYKLSRILSPSPHIAMVSSRAFKFLGSIMRLSKDLKLAKQLKSLYCALVHPISEYGSII